MATIGVIQVSVLARTKKFEKGMKKVSKRVKRLKREVAAAAKGILRMGAVTAAAAAGVAVFVRQSMTQIDVLAKTADKLGLTTEALGGLQHAAALTGVSANVLDKGLQNMVRNIADFSTGTGEAKDELEQMGISVSDIINLSPDKQFKLIAERMKGIKNNTDRVNIAYKIFGGRATALINTLVLGADGIDEATKEAIKLGIAVNRIDAKKIEEANDAITRMQGAFRGIFNTLAIKLAPAIKEMADGITDASKETEGFKEQMRGTAKFTIKSVDAIRRGWIGIEIAVVSLGVAIRKLFEFTNPIAFFSKEFAADTKLMVDHLKDLNKQFLDTSGRDAYLASLDKIIDATDKTRKATEAFEKSVERLSEKKHTGAIMEDLFKQVSAGTINTKQADKLLKAALKSRREIIKEAQRQEFTDVLKIPEQKEIKRNIGLPVSIDRPVDPAFAAATEEAKRQLEKMAMNAEHAAAIIQQTLGDSLLMAMEGNFSDIGKSFTNMLKRMAAEAAASAIMKQLLHTNEAGKVGGLFADFFVAAHGGRALPNRPVLVGEAGPEVVVPGSTSSVIPNGGLSGMGGVTVQMTVVTPDAGSFRRSEGQITSAAGRALQSARRRNG